jgi:hypothetical protein
MASVMVESPVDEEAAAALTDPHQLQAVGELVKPSSGQRRDMTRWRRCWKPPAARPLMPA